MTGVDALLVLLAGTAAGAINAAVGSGSLITFPTLLAVGIAPVPANVSNNIGLVPGGLASVWGYRRELAGQRRRLLVLGPMSLSGGVAGAVVLLAAPPEAFRAVVPVLIGLAVVLEAVQPWLSRRLAGRGDAGGSARVGPAAMAATAACGVYGGYFGGAQGILLVGALGTMLTETLQRLNALKNGLVTGVNAVAAVTFLVAAPDRVDWPVVGLIAVGSTAGGLLGARLGRRLPPAVLRGVIVVVGLVAIVALLLPA